ncbi:MAG: glycosyltransferase family 4 protein [Phycisphaerales bacterium]|nr:glycosyltransferase family 4 protein [Phycisphaerales bacterium]
MPGHHRPTPGPSAPLRVAMLWPGRAGDAGALSGMPAGMAGALERRGVEFVHIETPAPGPPPVPRRFRAHARAARHALRDTLEHLAPRATHSRMLDRAHARAEHLGRELRRLRPDLLFGCCISTSLAFLETDTPVVYFSDATPRLINTTYPAYARRTRAYHDACDLFELGALQRTTLAAYASEAALRSAIDDYALDPDRAVQIPMGANITPERPVAAPHEPPTRRRLNLAFIGADPARKRLDLCVAAAELLGARGWRTTLRVIGPLTSRAARSHAVEPLGRLSLADPGDLARARAAIAGAHFLLLPSVAEAFGIAPCEAAHFAVPAIVSDAGGLPSVVLDGATGRVLPTTAGPEAYADAIEQLAADPDGYRRCSLAALARAHRTLNWDAWAGRMHTLFLRAAGRPLPSVTVLPASPAHQPG